MPHALMERNFKNLFAMNERKKYEKHKFHSNKMYEIYVVFS